MRALASSASSASLAPRVVRQARQRRIGQFQPAHAQRRFGIGQMRRAPAIPAG